MKNLLVLLSCVFIFSCKNDSKETKEIEETNETISPIIVRDNEIENALFNGTFVKNNNGYDVVFYNNNLYLLKINPSAEDKTNHFFLEIKRNKDNLPTIDINPIDYVFNDSLSENFKNVAVYKYPVTNKNDTYDIIIGQFNENGRVWNSYMSDQSIRTKVNQYKNEYLDNLKSNRFLKDLESAFDQGYFIQHKDNFDLLIDKNVIYYIRANGYDADLETQFYLHITYRNKTEKLNTVFNAKEYQINELLGPQFKNFIIIKKEIPSTGEIVEIGTGQFNTEGRTWGVLYNLDSLYDNMAFIYNDQYKQLEEE